MAQYHTLLPISVLIVFLFLPERYLEVLSTPHVHFHVIFAELDEVLAVDAEQSTSDDRGLYHASGVTESLVPLQRRQEFPLRNIMLYQLTIYTVFVGIVTWSRRKKPQWFGVLGTCCATRQKSEVTSILISNKDRPLAPSKNDCKIVSHFTICEQKLISFSDDNRIKSLAATYLEDQVPVEAPSQVGRGADVLEVVHVYYIDDRRHHARPILCNGKNCMLVSLIHNFHIWACAQW